MIKNISIFSIKNKSIIRHRILKGLYDKMETFRNPKIPEDVSLTELQIISLLKRCNKNSLHLNLDYLINQGEIDCQYYSNIGFYIIEAPGRDSYIEKKHLRSNKLWIFKTERLGWLIEIFLTKFI